MNKPLVSVVMATFNDSPDLLKIAIESIILQTIQNWEYLIVDDSDNIETIEVINSYSKNDERIIVIRDNSRIGFVSALNKGLKIARGQYIARMDGDDISHPKRFEKQLNFLETNQTYSVVGSDVNLINTCGEITSTLKFPEKGIQFRIFTMFRCPIQHGNVMMRRSLIDLGINYDENYKRSEDLELWLRLMKNDIKLYNIKETLYDFRIDNNYPQKRSKEHFRYNLKARIKNFSFKYPISGLSGIMISYLYMNTPIHLKKMIYNRLNNKSY